MTKAQQHDDAARRTEAPEVHYPGLGGALLSDRAEVRTLTQANALLDAFLGRARPATGH